MNPEDVPAELVEKAMRGWQAPRMHINTEPERTKARLRDVLAAVIPEIQAQALRDAADSWQRGEWASAPRRADRVQERIANGQYVGDWLRDRAGRLACETEDR